MYRRCSAGAVWPLIESGACFSEVRLYIWVSQATYIEGACAARGEHFARVKLERGHGVVVLERLHDVAHAQVPNAHGLVERAGHEVHLVKLQAADRRGVAEERAVRLAGAQVPQTHAAVAAAARQRVAPELHAADKVLEHFPAPVLVRGRGVGKGARELVRNASQRVNVWIGRRRRKWIVGAQVDHGVRAGVRHGPQDVHREHTLARLQVPLPQRLVRGARDEAPVVKVERRDAFRVPFERAHARVLGVLAAGAFQARRQRRLVVVDTPQVPQAQRMVERAGDTQLVLDLEALDRVRVAAQPADLFAGAQVPDAHILVGRRRDERAVRLGKVERRDRARVVRERHERHAGRQLVVLRREEHGPFSPPARAAVRRWLLRQERRGVEAAAARHRAPVPLELEELGEALHCVSTNTYVRRPARALPRAPRRACSAARS